jgi:hypothetical protein
VSVLLGNGNGTFAAAVNYSVGQNPEGLAQGDLNGDSEADLVTANFGGTVSVLLNQSPATHLGLAAPAGVTAGAPFSLTVTALNQGGQVATGYAGTVHFTSTDPKATLPANYTFTGGDQGVHTFMGLSLTKVGAMTVTATDTVTGSITGSAGVTVSPGAATHFKITGPSNSVAGSAVTLTVTALDAFGNTATGYLGTVHFTSTDGSAVLPADYPFVAGDKGKHTFHNGVTLNAVGKQTVTVTDTVQGSVKGKKTITVAAAADLSLGQWTELPLGSGDEGSSGGDNLIGQGPWRRWNHQAGKF